MEHVHFIRFRGKKPKSCNDNPDDAVREQDCVVIYNQTEADRWTYRYTLTPFVCPIRCALYGKNSSYKDEISRSIDKEIHQGLRSLIFRHRMPNPLTLPSLVDRSGDSNHYRIKYKYPLLLN